MKQKKTKIKIKRSKINLYNKKKSKQRQTISLIITVVAACVLGVVGYGIGKPIFNYLQNREQYTSSDDSGSWSSPESDNSGDSDNSSGGGDSSEENSAPEEDPPEPINTNPKMYVLPENAAASSASLNSALAVAKEAGCGIVVATLKDDFGTWYYKSDIEAVKDTELIQGSLTAAQICEYITKAGMVPAARISTLKDSNTPRFTEGGYKINGSVMDWVDYFPDQGGKRWFSPFDPATVSLVQSVAEELSAAGFKHIVCVNTSYPTFHTSDVSNYLANLPITDSASRVEALWNVINAAKTAAEKNNAKLWVELSGANLIKEQKSATDAELALDAANLGTVGIIADYTSGGSAADAYQEALDFAKSVKSAAAGADLAVLISSGLSGSALSDAEKAFKESNLEIFTEG